MSDVTIDQIGPPKQFGLDLPGWWPHVEILTDIGDEIPEVLPPEQAAAISEMLASVNPNDGTRMVSVMMSAEDVPRPLGIMYINHSEKAAHVMSGMLGIDATPAEVPSLSAIGKLRDTEVSVVHFDTVGSVSCVSSRRESSNPDDVASRIRAYLIPQPQTFKAVLILFMTPDHEAGREPVAELCDAIVSSFSWRW